MNLYRSAAGYLFEVTSETETHVVLMDISTMTPAIMPKESFTKYCVKEG